MCAHKQNAQASDWRKGITLDIHRPELVEKRLVSQEVDVFDVIVSLVLSLCLLLGLSRMYALEDAQPPARRCRTNLARFYIEPAAQTWKLPRY